MLLLCGCALISGLEGIKVTNGCDACADGAVEAGADASVMDGAMSMPDTSTMDVQTSDVPIVSDGIRCGDNNSKICQSSTQVCCMPGTECVTQLHCSDTALQCDDQLDCAGGVLRKCEQRSGYWERMCSLGAVVHGLDDCDHPLRPSGKQSLPSRKELHRSVVFPASAGVLLLQVS